MERYFRAASVLCLAVSGIAAPLQTPTPQDVADGILYARGGMSRVQNITTERMTGRVYVGGRQGTFIREVMRPNKLRMEITLDGETTISGFNGVAGWKRQVSASGSQNTKLAPSEDRKMAEDADIDGPFMSFSSKGIAIELLDKEMLGPSVVWKIKVTSKPGDSDLYYVESTGHYILMRESNRIQEGKPFLFDSIYKDFRRVEGVLFPFTVVSLAQDGMETTTLRFDNIQLNAPVNDSDFELPTGGQVK